VPTHNVQQGDYVPALAEKYGFRDSKTIWDHPSNAALKAKRKNPNILFPGDVVVIPDKNPKVESIATTRAHYFRIKTEVLKLKLRLLDIHRTPRVNVACELEVDGAGSSETTDGEGKLTKPIARSAKAGKLTTPDLEAALLIGHLDPLEEQSGQIGRLNNLGYDAGDPQEFDAMRFRSAVEEFQCDYGLTVDGICG